MNVMRWKRLRRLTAGALSGAALLLGTSSCGGSGGSGTGATLTGMVLVDFLQAGQDNVPLNRVLEFRFSAAVDPNFIDPASIQIREGPSFGAAVFGRYIIQGDRVLFEPRLPGLCDLSDSGFRPNTDYRVTFIGSPEEFAIRNLAGEPLQATVAANFHTRLDTDPELFEDQVPGALPSVVATSPVNGTPDVPVGSALNNVVSITFSENLNPCSVSENSILLFQYATGGPGGFFPAIDQTPGDPFSWGSGLAQVPPRRIRCTFSLQQDFLATTLTLTPIFGEFPDNALLVAQVTNQVKDFGGNPILPFNFSFTTENRPPQTKALTFQFDGDVPINTGASTGEVNTARAPSRAQGFLLVAGDGDNGANLLIPSGPDNSKGPLGCTAASFQPNDGTPDDFDPLVDTLLSTGATRNTCLNSTDGTTAVVFEYRTFRIRTGVTVRLTGVNAAIILVRGDINIESGARLLARGDGSGGAPQSNGTGGALGTITTEPAGGIAVAGGGNGGFAGNTSGAGVRYSGNGTAGTGSPDAFLAPGAGGVTDPVRVGAGRGAVGTFITTSTNPGANRMSPGGGGGGHSTAGGTGQNNGQAGGMITLMDNFVDGVGGGTYGNIDGKMFKAEAGSGAGGGGLASGAPYFTGNTTFQGTGGAGGAGGGFVDLTTTADIKIFGTIDAKGGNGGTGVTRYYGGNAFYGGAGGGGGGSGGGVRLLTPQNIVLGSGTTLTVAGGSPGGGPAWAQGGAAANPGGNGGLGRLVLEDSDSVIQGLGAATVVPTDGAPAGFYRGVFDPTRFQGGGIRPVVVTNLIDTGPFSPNFLTADQQYVPPVAAPGTPRQDFIAGIPPVARNPNGTHTGIFIEIQGYPSNPDGTANTLAPSGWKSVGFFKDSGSQTFPTWVANAQPPAGDIAYAGGILSGNTGNGINLINGNEFIQFRITFYLPTTIGVFDGGPYIDSWTLNFQYDQ